MKYRTEIDGLRDLALGRVDHGDRAADLGRDVGELAVAAEHHVAWPVADQEVAGDLELLRVDHRDRVAGFGGDVDGLSVGADRHALRFDPGRELGELGASGSIDPDRLTRRLDARQGDPDALRTPARLGSK